MYALAGRLDPADMRDVAGRVYREMAAAGYGAVGEFHYVHHRPEGTPYDEPNAMALAVARRRWSPVCGPSCSPPPTTAAGTRASATVGRRRSSRAWTRCAARRLDVGVAAHSVRAVPADWLREIAAYADAHGLVRHIHAHEQPRELEECQAEHGCSPIELLHRTGFLGERTTVVHAIHVDDRDISLLAETGTIVATCPTTEGNLGDGHFPALRYRDAGVRMAIGSDSNVVVDPFEEVRELETGARRERPDAARAARRGRRSLGRCRERTARPRWGSRTPAAWRSTSTTRACAASPRPTSRARSLPAVRRIR